MEPVVTSTPSTSASRPETVCVANRSLRLENRPAMTPPYGAATSMGRNCSAVTVPSAVPDPVRRSTSQDCATACIQLPDSEIACPMKYNR
jgi:hypothetical protein